MRYLMPVVLLVSLCACGTVHVAAPVGDAPLVIDAGDWEGTWCEPSAIPFDGSPIDFTNHFCLRVTVVDPAAGVLDVTSEHPENSGDADTERMHLGRITGAAGEALVTSENGDGLTLVARIRRTGTLLVGWDSHCSGFAALIDRRTLQGRYKGNEVWLDALDSAATARVAADADRTLFDWTEPWVLVKVRSW